MLAEDRDDSCSKQLLQLGIIQLAAETESALHLLYTDTILSLKNTLFNNSRRPFNAHSVLSLVMEVQQISISSIHFTFGTLFHLSLERPKRPLTLQTSATPKALAKRCCRSDRGRCGRKEPSKSGSKKQSALKMTFRSEADISRNSSFAAITPPTPVPLAVTDTYYPGWRSRRHSITAHNASSRLSSVAPTDRRLSRRFSIGMADECGQQTAFSATTMYAKIVSHLENNLEPGRHFHRLQRFNDCFCGHSMVECLLAYCLTTLNSCIKREKATEMCRRLLGHGVIENVSHRKQQETEGMVFKDSRLYRFTGNHFWEESSITSELDGATTSASMPSLTQPGGIKRQRASSIKKMYTSFPENKTGFVGRCKSRFSLRGSHTI